MYKYALYLQFKRNLYINALQHLQIGNIYNCFITIKILLSISVFIIHYF